VHCALHPLSALRTLFAHSALPGRGVVNLPSSLLAHSALHALLVYSALPLHSELHTHTTLPVHCALACTKCHA